MGGILTHSAASAYIEALEFCLAQVGSPTQCDTTARHQIIHNLAQKFPLLPLEVQQNLANAEKIWQNYQQTWNFIDLDEKKSFAYDVLSLGYGETAAANALGISTGNSAPETSGSAGNASSYSGDANFSSNGSCSIVSTEYGSISSGC